MNEWKRKLQNRRGGNGDGETGASATAVAADDRDHVSGADMKAVECACRSPSDSNRVPAAAVGAVVAMAMRAEQQRDSLNQESVR